MIVYVIDSDILSYMLDGNKTVQKNFDDVVGEEEHCIPPLVFYEVKRGLEYKKATAKLRAFKELYDSGVKNEMTEEMWQKSIDIYVMLKAKGRLIGDGDVFIAAFCIINDYVLLTNNSKHFDNIPELKTVNIARP
jgi:predicted nucleic acid-binding protein